MLKFTSARREMFAGTGWSRQVQVGTEEFTVSVRRGKAVRIMYKPRGQNIGFHWYGSVYRVGGGHVWTDRVAGSIGCRGILAAAGIL